MEDQRERPAQDETSEPMYVGYAREFQVSEQLQLADERGIMRRLNRAIVYYLGAYCCNLDLQVDRPESLLAPCSSGENENNERTCEIMAARRARQNFGLVQSKWKRQLRFGWIAQLILACYFAFVGYLLVALYYQYTYDFDLLRLRKLRELRQATNTSILGRLATRETEIIARMNATKTMLNLLGPDYSHISILVECFYLSVVMFVTVIYLSIFVFYRFQRPFDYHMIRDLLDRQRESANIKRLVERQVAKYIESSRVFHENLVNCEPTLAFQQETNLTFVLDDGRSIEAATACAPSKLFDARHSASVLSATLRRERELNLIIHEMLASGALTPLYNTRAWIERRTRLQFIYHMALLVYAIVFDASLSIGFFAQTDPSTDSGHPLIQVACIGLLTIAGPSVVVHAPIFIVVVLEQLSYVQQLRVMAKRCIRENTRVFARRRCGAGSHKVRVTLNQSHSAPDLTTSVKVQCLTERMRAIEGEVRSTTHASELTSHERTINSNLIFLILHYKIFVAQLLPIKRSMGFVNIIALFILFTMPIIARIHEPYMSELNDGSRLSDAQLKIFTILISSSILVPANLTSGPLCFMFARCEDLYRDLASLMAHISEVKSHSASAGGGGDVNIYDSHAENCLLKELSDSKRLLEQLTVRAAGIAGTYTVLVKVHFWYGLLAISNLVDGNYGQNNGGGGELLNSLFSDPLGVYSTSKVY